MIHRNEEEIARLCMDFFEIRENFKYTDIFIQRYPRAASFCLPGVYNSFGLLFSNNFFSSKNELMHVELLS